MASSLHQIPQFGVNRFNDSFQRPIHWPLSSLAVFISSLWTNPQAEGLDYKSLGHRPREMGVTNPQAEGLSYSKLVQ
jgi:hypothetical protein